MMKLRHPGLRPAGRIKAIALAVSVGLLTSTFFASCAPKPIVAAAGTPPATCATQFEGHLLPENALDGAFKKDPMKFDSVVFEDGVLSFTQNAPERHIRVYMGVKEGDVPAGQVFQVIPPGASLKEAPISGAVDKMVLEWIDTNENGERVMKSQTFSQGPALWLTFADPNAPDPKNPQAVTVKKMLGDTIDGQVYACFNDAAYTHVAGQFKARIKGFRLLPNGQPDLSTDSVKNFRYLALKHLKEENAQIDVEVISENGGRIEPSATPDAPSTGYIEITYRRDKFDEEGARLTKFQFVKDGGKWRIHEALQGHQLGEAHPPRLPDPRSHAQMVYLAAQKIENEVNKEFPGAQIKSFTHHITTFEVPDVAKINVRYRLEGEQFSDVPQQTEASAAPTGQPAAAAATSEYDLDSAKPSGIDFSRNFALKLRADDKGWEVTQELTGTQEINAKTGAIEGVGKDGKPADAKAKTDAKKPDAKAGAKSETKPAAKAEPKPAAKPAATTTVPKTAAPAVKPAATAPAAKTPPSAPAAKPAATSTTKTTTTSTTTTTKPAAPATKPATTTTTTTTKTTTTSTPKTP